MRRSLPGRLSQAPAALDVAVEERAHLPLIDFAGEGHSRRRLDAPSTPRARAGSPPCQRTTTSCSRGLVARAGWWRSPQPRSARARCSSRRRSRWPTCAGPWRRAGHPVRGPARRRPRAGLLAGGLRAAGRFVRGALGALRRGRREAPRAAGATRPAVDRKLGLGRRPAPRRTARRRLARVGLQHDAGALRGEPRGPRARLPARAGDDVDLGHDRVLDEHRQLELLAADVLPARGP